LAGATPPFLERLEVSAWAAGTVPRKPIDLPNSGPDVVVVPEPLRLFRLKQPLTALPSNLALSRSLQSCRLAMKRFIGKSTLINLLVRFFERI